MKLLIFIIDIKRYCIDGCLSREVIDFFVFYAKTVFERYKDKVKYCMTFNEINVLSGWCQIGHQINSNNKIGMMVSYTPSYPMTCQPEDVTEAIEFNRQKAFYMDVQVRGYYPEYQLKKFEKNNISIHMEKDDLDSIKDGTGDFSRKKKKSFKWYKKVIQSHGDLLD